MRATDRALALHAYKNGDPSALEKYSERTYREWARRYEEAQQAHGNGFVGLFDQVKRRGFRESRISPQAQKVLDESLWNDYARANARSKRAAFLNYLARTEEQVVEAISYEWYKSLANKLDKGKLVAARSGNKARYQLGANGPHTRDPSELLPPHGDRAWELAHIDHTILPVELVSAITHEPIGTAWLSLLVDAHTRVILAHALSLEAPSIRSLMVLLRECVRRHGRLPQRILVDNGADFRSTYFVQLLIRCGVELAYRPPGKPRTGSIVESLFGSVEAEIIRQLTGATTNRDLDRSLSSTHDPRKHAIWTPDALDDLLEEYFYTVYPNKRHLGLHDTPARLFKASVKEAGTANCVHIRYDMAFYTLTLPEVRGRTRRIRNGQIRVENLDYRPTHGASAIQYNEQSVPVRYDPYDPTYIYAYFGGEWHECVTTNALLLRAREQNVRHLAIEVAGRARNSGRSYRSPTAAYIDFTRKVQETEATLRRSLERPSEGDSPSSTAAPHPAEQDAPDLGADHDGRNTSSDPDGLAPEDPPISSTRRKRKGQ